MQNNFRNLEIYNLAHNIVIETYKLTENFPTTEKNNLISQMRRAATSLPLNIAEGSGSNSNKVFLNFLIFSYRSSLETEAALKIALDLKYITKEIFEEYFEKLDCFIRKIYKYIQYIDSKITKEKSPWYKNKKWEIDNQMTKRKNNN